MKSIILYFVLIFSAGITAYSQKTLTIEEFQKSCDSIGLSFDMPVGYKVIDVKDNPNLWYSFAIQKVNSVMEVRYTIWPLKPAVEQYERSLKDSTFMMIPPNNIYLGRIQANVLNMTGGIMYDIGAFPTEAVKKEFNADAGGSCFFNFNCEFGKGYKFGQFIYLHKDDIADVIITYMFNNKEKRSDVMLESFYALRFK